MHVKWDDGWRFPALLKPIASALAVTVAATALGSDAGKFTLTCLEIPDIGRGAGLALVLQTPGGKTWLYDTGSGYREKDGSWTGNHNSGRDLIAPFLKERGIKELDGVIISHAHLDHFGGLVWLVDNVGIRRLIDSGYKFGGSSTPDYQSELGMYENLREGFQRREGAYRAVHAGDKLALDDCLDVEVLAPPKEFFAELHPEKRPKNDPAAHYQLNANALILRITHGRIVFLLGGDIELQDQVEHLLPSVPREKLKCHALIAPGHGLHSAPEFAEAARPEVTVASIFGRWGKGCTARRVYAAVGSKVYVTGLHGNVRIESDGASYRVETQRESKD
ncbi:MAG TPA: MBL fold metallo-hydrolase [Verrucomicrobiae bacterium]|nr:MBL fold metallo-hydrolase [Verrucomicrobiae bacterium]